MTAFTEAAGFAREGMPVERRIYTRREVHLKADAVRIDNNIDACQHPAMRLSVEDFSDGGLLAFCNTRLKPGEGLAMFFPSHMGQQIYDLYGRVTRCLDHERGYQIGVEFYSQAA